MYTIEGNGMPRKKQEGPTVHFQLKLYGEEAERWLKVSEQARSRNRRLDDTEINRQLLGLDPCEEITERERLIFQGAKTSKRAEMVGRAPHSKPHIKDISPRLKRK